MRFAVREDGRSQKGNMLSFLPCLGYSADSGHIFVKMVARDGPRAHKDTPSQKPMLCLMSLRSRRVEIPSHDAIGQIKQHLISIAILARESGLLSTTVGDVTVR